MPMVANQAIDLLIFKEQQEQQILAMAGRDRVFNQGQVVAPAAPASSSCVMRYDHENLL
jgi:hypothetical protein